MSGPSPTNRRLIQNGLIYLKKNSFHSGTLMWLSEFLDVRTGEEFQAIHILTVILFYGGHFINEPLSAAELTDNAGKETASQAAW